ncbi:hypothetical protein GEV33_015190 [Tenebrio molitor]|uniref:G-protein coupled receptors family 1 profile domain-containing protein n=1 Tax=Tenebrio molitor TaxID=7067 RepID=A0A8J6H4J0_TENMO|nr:hypothetical protein GEV33_015190 [Tenebrio molitor]
MQPHRHPDPVLRPTRPQIRRLLLRVRPERDLLHGVRRRQRDRGGGDQLHERQCRLVNRSGGVFWTCDGTGGDEGAGWGANYDWSFLFVVVFIIAGGLGNILVCLAVILDRRLQNVTNYFLLSLAIADLLVSLFVMPLGAIPGFLVSILRRGQSDSSRADSTVRLKHVLWYPTHSNRFNLSSILRARLRFDIHHPPIMKSLINGGCAGVNSPVAAMLFYSERTSLKKKARCAPSHRKKLGNSAELIAFPKLEFLTPPAISEAITNSPHQARTQMGVAHFSKRCRRSASLKPHRSVILFRTGAAWTWEYRGRGGGGHLAEDEHDECGARTTKTFKSEEGKAFVHAKCVFVHESELSGRCNSSERKRFFDTSFESESEREGGVIAASAVSGQYKHAMTIGEVKRARRALTNRVDPSGESQSSI